MEGCTIIDILRIHHEIEEDIQKNIHPNHSLNWPATIGGLHKCSDDRLKEMIRELKSVIKQRKKK